MSATHPLFAIVALAVALLTAWLLSRFSAPAPAKHYGSLDGLRGLLAVLVIISHAANWRGYALTGEWGLPPSRLYSHFGESSVALFFMITAFLFGSKLLDSRTRPMNWDRLYISRALRLAPLYVSFVAIMVSIALVSAGLTLHESVPRFGLNVVHWLAFTMMAMPALNGFAAPVVGGAAWSLPYEWWFYFALPAMGLVLGIRRAPVALVVASTAATLLAGYWVTSRGGWPIAAVFLGGWAAAFLVRQPTIVRIAQHPLSTVAALVAMAAATRVTTGFHAPSTLLLSVGFIVIACGNTLFGALTSRPMRTLGEMAYSIYLLHGIGLYLAFSALGAAAAARLTPAQHWMVVSVAIAVIVSACRLTFRAIEAPGMAAVDQTTAWLETRFRRASAAAVAAAGE